jgi:conjugative transfer signal peptidase TraF
MSTALLGRRVDSARFAAVAAFIALPAVVLLAASHFLINVTPSLPQGIYLTSPPKSVAIGDVVFFPQSAVLDQEFVRRAYVPANAFLLKPVAAVEGQHVCVREGAVFIDGHLFSHLQGHDRAGRIMAPYPICRALAPGEIWAAVSDDQSLDSRYFGPVPASAIAGKARALWTY